MIIDKKFNITTFFIFVISNLQVIVNLYYLRQNHLMYKTSILLLFKKYLMTKLNFIIKIHLLLYIFLSKLENSYKFINKKHTIFSLNVFRVVIVIHIH